jgi:hypothetical protein
MWKVTRSLGLDVVAERRSDTLASVLWLNTTQIPEAFAEPGMLNRRCLDIRKTRVDQAMLKAFGYSLDLDPRSHRGLAVRRTNSNGRHDGEVVMCPLEPASGFIYQRLVNNRVADTVEDLRLAVVGRCVPVVYVKYHSIQNRFKGEDARSARLCRAEEVFSPQELEKLLAVCADMGLDVGEVDVLRDRDSGRLYVIDVNDTSWGPDPAFSRRDAIEGIRRTATAFTALIHGSLDAPRAVRRDECLEA